LVRISIRVENGAVNGTTPWPETTTYSIHANMHLP
jgi:hypothetical protein